MRTFLIAALLAGVATPALAARPHDGDGGRSERSERSEAKESAPKQERSAERPQPRIEPRSENEGGPRVDKSANSNARRAIDTGNTQAVEQVRRGDGGNEVRGNGQKQQVVETGDAPHRNFEPKEVRPPRNSSKTVSAEHSSGDSVRNWRSRERQTSDRGTTIEQRNLRRAPGKASGELVQPKHPAPRVIERGERRISHTPMRGAEPPAPRSATSRQAHAARHWNGNWRNDHRYDWRNWRRHHHSHFHLGFYYDPFGWDYFRYGVGWRLWPNYYRNSFWLNDPWQYRLPPAYGPYRWVRYFNDALLVNIYTGEVVDVEYNFFW